MATKSDRPRRQREDPSSDNESSISVDTPISSEGSLSSATRRGFAANGEYDVSDVSAEEEDDRVLGPSRSRDGARRKRVLTPPTAPEDSPGRRRTASLPDWQSEADEKTLPGARVQTPGSEDDSDGDLSRRPTLNSSRASSQTPSRYRNTSIGSKPPKPSRSPSGKPSRSRSKLPSDSSSERPPRRPPEPSCFCAPFRALKRLWDWFWSWEGWILVRAYIAVPVALAIAGIMVGIAATGPIVGDWWWFCTATDVKLGGLGYCQGGTCTSGIAYSVPDVEASIPADDTADAGDGVTAGTSSTPLSVSVALAVPTSFENTIILCVLLYFFALIGTISSIMMLYIGLLTSCRSSDSVRSLNPCATDPSWRSDVEDRTGKMDEARLDRTARYDNRISEDDWAKLKRDDKNRMRMEARFRIIFVKTVDWTALAGLPVAIGLFVWVDQVDAEGDWAYSALIAWIVLVFPGWFLARKMFRATPKAVRDQKRQLFREAKSKAQAKVRGASSARRGTNEEHEMKERGRRAGGGNVASRSQSRGRQAQRV